MATGTGTLAPQAGRHKQAASSREGAGGSTGSTGTLARGSKLFGTRAAQAHGSGGGPAGSASGGGPAGSAGAGTLAALAGTGAMEAMIIFIICTLTLEPASIQDDWLMIDETLMA